MMMSVKKMIKLRSRATVILLISKLSLIYGIIYLTTLLMGNY